MNTMYLIQYIVRNLLFMLIIFIKIELYVAKMY